jgi:hypothetical protein
MGKLKEIGLQLIPVLPFLILAMAIVIATYHIKVYW